jgi:hypothetical protein
MNSGDGNSEIDQKGHERGVSNDGDSKRNKTKMAK